MAKKKTEEPEVIEAVETEEVTEAKPTKANEAVIRSKNNGIVRIYSEEVHGKDYKKLAEEFVEHNTDFTIELR